MKTLHLAWLLAASVSLAGCGMMKSETTTTSGGTTSTYGGGTSTQTTAGASTQSTTGGSRAAAGSALQLTGANEVPPVTVTGSGTGTINVAADGAVSGSIKTTGVSGNAAHIHVGAAGTNGPVIIPLTQGAAGEWTVPAGAKLTEEQMRRYRAGELYVNVHTAANPGGEVRAQLRP